MVCQTWDFDFIILQQYPPLVWLPIFSLEACTQLGIPRKLAQLGIPRNLTRCRVENFTYECLNMTLPPEALLYQRVNNMIVPHESLTNGGRGRLGLVRWFTSGSTSLGSNPIGCTGVEVGRPSLGFRV
jgi:hypothetical protein